MALNDCIYDTTRYSVWHAGLLFGKNLSQTENGPLVIALAKSYLVLVFSVEDTPI